MCNQEPARLPVPPIPLFPNNGGDRPYEADQFPRDCGGDLAGGLACGAEVLVAPAETLLRFLRDGCTFGEASAPFWRRCAVLRAGKR